MTEHEGHEQAGTYHLRCAVCRVELKKVMGPDPMIQAWLMPTVNEKTGVISQPGTVLIRSKVDDLKAQGLALRSLLG